MKKLTRIARFKIRFLDHFINDTPLGCRLRGMLYEPYLRRCGKNFRIAKGAHINSPYLLSVGDNVYISFYCYLGKGTINLDDEVLIGNHVSITPSNHLRLNNSYRWSNSQDKGVTIGKGSWIGAHSCLLAGTKIGNGCVVVAGSLVTRIIKGNNKMIINNKAEMSY